MYANGRGIAKDEQQAVIWYRKAAEQGFADAQFLLGLYYELGKGVTKNDQQAVYWYRQAAKQGKEEARRKLTEM
ncbi:Localization factor PodJL [compost metagenome]